MERVHDGTMDNQPPYPPPYPPPSQGSQGRSQQPYRAPLRDGLGGPSDAASGGRARLSRWTRRIGWMGMVAAGAISFLAARSDPGRTVSTTTTTSGQVPAPAASPAGSVGGVVPPGTQSGISGSPTLQPAAQAPVTTFRQPFVRSGGS